MELLTNHTHRMLGAIAHDPPTVRILPDRDEQLRFFGELGSIAASEGSLRAFLLWASTTMDRPLGLFRSPTGRAAAAAALRTMLALREAAGRVRGREPDEMQRLFDNTDLLVRWEMRAFVDYEPDIEALRAVRIPWCLATGRDSAGRYYSRPAQVLSKKLGVACEQFPGGHTAHQQVPQEFTGQLTTILDGFSS